MTHNFPVPICARCTESKNPQYRTQSQQTFRPQGLNQSRNFPPQYRHVSKLSKSKLYLDLVSDTDDNKDDGAPSSSRFTSGGGGGGGPKTSSLRNSVPHREQNLEMSGSGIARKVRPQRTVLELLVSTCLVYYGWNMDLFPWRDHRIFF